MKEIAHIIHPVIVNNESDLVIAQPITFETMKVAKEFASKVVKVTLYAIQYHDEDRIQLPNCFLRVPELKQSAYDIKIFKKKRKLAILKDIIDSLYNTSNADYFIYTNVDIALQPYFYQAISKIIERGFDAFIINRRTISDKYTSTDDLPFMYSNIGKKHPGYDCFVFDRKLYPKFKLGSTCIGTNHIGKVLAVNLESYSNKFNIFDDLHLTFHIGDRQSWKRNEYDDYEEFNEKQLIDVLKDIQSDGIYLKNRYTNYYYNKYCDPLKNNGNKKMEFIKTLNAIKRKIPTRIIRTIRNLVKYDR